MGDYLTENELSELTGRRQPKRQAVWLARNGWRFAVTDFGKPRVARAYWTRRLADDTNAVLVCDASFGVLYMIAHVVAVIGHAASPGASVMIRLKSLAFFQSAVAAAAEKLALSGLIHLPA